MTDPVGHAQTPRPFVLFVLGIVLLFFSVLWFSAPSATAIDPTIGLGIFLVLAFLAETFPLNVGVGRATIGVSGTVFWALTLVYGPFWASVLASVTVLAANLLGRTPVLKSTFNAAQVGISLFLGGTTIAAIWGSTHLNANPRFFLSFLIAIIVFWLVNTGLVSLGASFAYQESASRFWKRNFQWAWIYEVTSAPIALAVVFAYTHLAAVGLVLVALPILMVRLAYSQYLNLKRTYRETVRTLIKVIEMHDPYTAGHSDRVANYARRLCEALNLSPANTEKIELAAYLHDLGKIHLDLTGIVRKAGKLTEDERRMVRLHPVMSADLANQVSYFQGEIEAMIRHHHENWDGSGYPHGLQGENIPLGSRVILLADSFDAMTTSRVYREALDIEFVKNEFIKFSGIQFDPDLVPVFLDKVVRNGEGIISKPIDEPMEGLRARAPEVAAKRPTVRTLPRRDAI